MARVRVSLPATFTVTVKGVEHTIDTSAINADRLESFIRLGLRECIALGHGYSTPVKRPMPRVKK